MDVLLTIVSRQRFMDEKPEETNLVTQGCMQIDAGRIEISYPESELTGLVGTTTTFCIENGHVSLKRIGAVQSTMNFIVGQEDRSLYDMGFGALMITVRTERIEINLDENGGTLRVAYGIIIENEAAGFIEYNIEVKPI